MNQLHIEKPCPIYLNESNKKGSEFYCKSCKKSLIDFRDKSQEEILPYVGKNVCGVFNSNQLSGQQKLSFSKSMVFKFFTVLSFLGFPVSPLKAQESKVVNKKEIIQKEKLVSERNNTFSIEKPRKKKKKGKGKTEFKTIGCPSF